MAKKMAKRSLALGALMAFVITGSAMAADLADGTSVANGDWTVSSNVTIDGPAKTVVGVVGDGGIANTITVADGVTFTAVSNGGGGNCNGVIANTKIEGNGDIVLVSKGAYPASGLGQESVDSIKGNSISITSKNGYGIYSSAAGESHTLEAKTITVTSDQHAVMANTSSNVTIKGFDELTLTADHEGSGVYSGGSSSVEIEGKNASINGDQRAAIAGESAISIKVDNLTATTQNINTSETDPRKNSVISANKDGNVTLEVSNKLVVNTNGQDGVNAINVEQGVIGIEGNPNTIQIDGDVKAKSGKLTGFNVSGAESYVTGSINTDTNENAKIEFSNGATWNNEGISKVAVLTVNDATVNTEGATAGELEIGHLDGKNATFNLTGETLAAEAITVGSVSDEAKKTVTVTAKNASNIGDLANAVIDKASGNSLVTAVKNTETAIQGDVHYSVEDGKHVLTSQTINSDLNVNGSLSVNGTDVLDVIDHAVAQERIDRITADKSQDEALRAETTRAEAAEKALDERISSESARLDSRIDKVDEKIDKVGAMAAAIANLRTMGYDPEAPSEFAVGVGQYRNETGVALGFFHYPNKDFMLSLSVSTSGDEVMGGIGATWKFGRKK